MPRRYYTEESLQTDIDRMLDDTCLADVLDALAVVIVKRAPDGDEIANRTSELIKRLNFELNYK